MSNDRTFDVSLRGEDQRRKKRRNRSVEIPGERDKEVSALGAKHPSIFTSMAKLFTISTMRGNGIKLRI